MHTLYLLRHAKSSWLDPTLTDEQRPLAARGRRDAKRVARHLADLGAAPELVLCSAAQRTRETLELVRPALGTTPSVIVDAELYGATADELLEHVRAVPDRVASVLMIAHNPGLHDLAVRLASAGPDLPRLEAKFPTAALATLALPKVGWSRLSHANAVLDAFVVPKQLR
jgi:phosphohistidine phosphatase